MDEVKSISNRILVCGGGHQGLSMAAHLALNGENVVLWNRTEEHILKVKDSGIIYCDGIIKKEDYDDFSYYVKKVLLVSCGNLRFVSDRLKDDYDVALNWVRIFPFSIGYVSERLRNDKEFVKKALIYVPYVVLNRIAELNICNMEDVVIKEKSFLEMMNDIVEVQ